MILWITELIFHLIVVGNPAVRNINVSSAFSATQSLKIRVHLEDSSATNSLTLVAYEYLLDAQFSESVSLKAVKDSRGNYDFQINKLNSAIYISLFQDSEDSVNVYSTCMLNLYLAEPGDIIEINAIKDTTYHLRRIMYTASYFQPVYSYQGVRLIFTGKGPQKYQCRYNIDRAIAKDTSALGLVSQKGQFVGKADYYSKSQLMGNRILNEFKKQITEYAYNTLKTDLIASLEIERMQVFLLMLSNRRKDTLFLFRLLKSYQSKLKANEIVSVPIYYKVISSKYCEFIVTKSLLDMRWLGTEKVYTRLKNSFRGELKDKVISLFVIKASLKINTQDILNDALLTVKTNYCLKELNSFIEYNSIGKVAYDFSLPDTSQGIIRLSDFIGKVVFIDFWYNGCPGCVDYYSNVVSKVENYFKGNSDICFITISIDANRKKWMEGIYSGKYTSPKIINLNTNGKGEDHPIIKNFRVNSYPRPLLIDKEGKIFSNNYNELRGGGPGKLIETINRALANK